ncbi:MAG TPA: GAF domain-containing protein [Rhodocyclaceae bacterium]|jgi:putative methionine-R-sulfoxide reductase with GAF domain|nr:GAF domain-containing protein [Rhodocyclaceae bacterium]
MSTVNLDPLRNCFEGAVPGPLATCDLDGIPNISYLSQVQYVDREHIALTFQFFNKTRRNVLANPNAQLGVVDPETGNSYRLNVHYLRTETSGPLFESMKAKLAGIASHTGMAGIFKLMGADVYRVSAVEPVGTGIPRESTRINNLPILRKLTQQLNQCADLSALLDSTLNSLRKDFGISHAMILMLDESGQRLYTVASSGYAESGIGSEIPLGAGVIGVAARERTAIRISHMNAEYAYNAAIRDNSVAHGFDLETAIPLPGIAESRSQLAVPIANGSCLYGVIYVEAEQDLRFSYDDEDALMTLANHLAMLMQQFAVSAEMANEATSVSQVATPQGKPVRVRHFGGDHSIFLDDDYLIKGVAGAIFWRLVQEYTQSARDSFSNRELRLDPSLALPELGDNLEARLLLLQRRLAERQACVQMQKTGRGRFRLNVNRPLLPQAEP